MKFILSILCVVSTTFFASSQKYLVEWGALESGQGKLVYLLPSSEQEFYALRWTGGQLLGSYQASRHIDFELKDKGRIKLTADNSMANFEGAKVIDGKFVVFLSDRREGQNHFYMQEYSKGIVPNGEPIKLASYDLDSKRSKGWFEVKMSSNEKFFGVVWEVPGKNDERDLYGFKIFDTDFNLINDGEYPLPFDPKLSTIHSHHISNNGDYFLALTEYEADPKKVLFKNPLNFKALHIYHIAQDGLQDFIIDVEGKRIEAMAMTSDNNNIFTITGIYGDEDYTGVSGVFHQTVDLNTEKVILKGFKKFDEEFITQDWSDRDLARAERRENRGKGNPQLYNYQMREATILNDGSIVGTMEQYYMQIRTFSDSRSGQTSNTYYYYYNDIIAYKISPEGSFDWVKKINKYQVSTNDGGPYSSYQSFVDNGKVYFIFNDNDRNYDDSGNFIAGDKMYTANYGRQRNAVALAEIDLNSGQIKRNTFFDRSEIDALAVPKLFNVNYKTGELLMYAIWGRKEKFGLLKFKE